MFSNNNTAAQQGWAINQISMSILKFASQDHKKKIFEVKKNYATCRSV